MNNILNILTNFHLAYAIISIFVCYVLLQFVIKNAANLMLIDIPNDRASHVIPTPSSGGLVLVLTLPFLFINQLSPSLDILVLSMFFLGFVGFVDDRIDLSSKVKFLAQIIVAVTFYFFDIKVKSLYGLFGIYELNEFLSFSLTMFLIVGIINAYNLIDGINGLLGSLSLLNLVIFVFTFSELNDGLFIIILFVGMFLISFLRFNFGKAKIFMGDTGSLPIGVLFSFLFISLFNENNSGSSSSLFLILFPCLDMVRLFASRIKNKKSPFKADKNHYHHLLLKFRNNHLIATVICLALQIAIFFACYIISSYKNFVAATFITLAVSLLIFVVAEGLLAIKNKNDIKINNEELNKLNKNKRLLINNK